MLRMRGGDYWVLIGASVGVTLGVATLFVVMEEEGRFSMSFLVYPAGVAVIGGAAGWAISALSELRHKNTFGAMVVWSGVLGASFVALGILGAIVEGGDPQVLVAFGAGASGGIAAGIAESYWRFLTDM